MSNYIGIDEVGRGCLAGPVLVAGVKTNDLPLLTYSYNIENWPDLPDIYQTAKDSKLLSAPKRFQISNLVESNFEFCLLSASNQLIDDFGIGVVLSHLILIICNLLYTKGSSIIIDGKIKLLSIFNQDLLDKIYSENNVEPIVLKKLSENVSTENLDFIPVLRENKADNKYLSVALASNIAKVKRDNLMDQLHFLHPEYLWNQNKGYGSLKHRQAIFNNPQNKFLRQTFIQKCTTTFPIK